MGPGPHRVRALLDLDRYAEALAHLAPLLAEHPQDPDLHGLRAEALLLSGDPNAALTSARRVVALGADAEWGHRLCALALAAQGYPVPAARAASEAIRLAPEAWQSHQTYAVVAADSGALRPLATEAAHRAAALAPTEPEVHFAVGLVAQKRGDRAAAGEAYRHTLALQPTHDAAMHNLAMVEHPGLSLRAVRAYAAALALRPDQAETRQNLTGLLTGFVMVTAFPLAALWLTRRTYPYGTWVAGAATFVCLVVALWNVSRLPRGARMVLPESVGLRAGVPPLLFTIGALALVVAPTALLAPRQWNLLLTWVVVASISVFVSALHARWRRVVDS